MWLDLNRFSLRINKHQNRTKIKIKNNRLLICQMDFSVKMIVRMQKNLGLRDQGLNSRPIFRKPTEDRVSASTKLDWSKDRLFFSHSVGADTGYFKLFNYTCNFFLLQFWRPVKYSTEQSDALCQALPTTVDIRVHTNWNICSA